MFPRNPPPPPGRSTLEISFLTIKHELFFIFQAQRRYPKNLLSSAENYGQKSLRLTGLDENCKLSAKGPYFFLRLPLYIVQQTVQHSIVQYCTIIVCCR